MPCGPQPPRTKVPKSALDDVVQMYHDNDPAPLTVETKQDPDGTYTVQAIFPPCPPKPTPAPAVAASPVVGGLVGSAPAASGAVVAAVAPSAPAAPPPAVAPPAPVAAPARRPIPNYGTFPADIVAAAQAAAKAWKVLASVSLAQWALESAWGTRMPVGSHNPFGIKAVGSEPFVSATTREFTGGRYVTLVAKFRIFPSIADAFVAHARLLATRAPYKKAMAVANDPDRFADALTGVYATDPHYGDSLKTLIKTYKLTQYD